MTLFNHSILEKEVVKQVCLDRPLNYLQKSRVCVYNNFQKIFYSKINKYAIN